MIRDSFPGAGFSGSRTRLQCSTHQASAVWWGVVCSSLRLSRKILGNSRARSKILGVICREFWEKLGFLHHQTASFAGAPITDDERCHVTQPHAGINVSCSRAGHNGAKRTTRRPRTKTSKGRQRMGARSETPV